MPGVAQNALTRPEIVHNITEVDFPAIVAACQIVLRHIEEKTVEEQKLLGWWLHSTEEFVRLNLPGRRGPAARARRSGGGVPPAVPGEPEGSRLAA